jgi:hypothetical protein
MIHMHNLFSSESNTSASGPSSSATLNQNRLEEFHGALSDAVATTHSNDAKTSLTRANDDTTSPSTTHPSTTTKDTSQRTAPPTPGSAAAASSTPSAATTSSATPNNGYDPFLQAASANPYQSAPIQTSTKSSTDSTPAPLDAQQAFDQAYWASQPPAVQALQNIQDPEQRAAVATQLANEGYSIDVPIMVWGWDPSITTAMRQSEGYTWVPSALQTPVEDAPGLASMGSLAAYNPNNPPAGSITV